MMTNLKYWLKGLAVAAVSMIIYAVALGCYMALMLLVISMEEGGTISPPSRCLLPRRWCCSAKVSGSRLMPSR